MDYCCSIGNKNCAPGIKYEEGSCMNKEEIGRIYNIIFKTFTKNLSKKNMVEKLNEYFRGYENQKYWIDDNYIKTRLSLEEYKNISNKFRHYGPETNTKWLTNFDIERVLQQYENYYKNFKFLGAVPLDFLDQPIYGISDINYKELLKKNIYKIGIVINLSKLGDPGTHWVAMFINLEKGEIYYYDSYADPPEKETLKYVELLKNTIKNKLYINCPKFFINNIVNQKKNIDCGVYCLRFIIKMVEGMEFFNVCKVITDDRINKCRNVYFS